MGAVDREDLELVAFHSPYPARNVRGLTIPFACVGITEFRHARLVLGECCERAKCNPGCESTFVTEARKDVAKHWHGDQRGGDGVENKPELEQKRPPRHFDV